MSEERDRERVGEEPWRDLPSDPWVKAGTIRVHRINTLGDSILVAVVVSDPASPMPGNPTPTWVHHWRMLAGEPIPLHPVQGGELTFRWISSDTGDAASVTQHDHLFDGATLVTRTFHTQIL